MKLKLTALALLAMTSVASAQTVTGNNNLAIGTNSTATGPNVGPTHPAANGSIAIGTNANAGRVSTLTYETTNKTAVGGGATAIWNNGTAVGNQANAAGGNATAVGQASRAVTDGTAIGRNAQANAANSTAIGSGATASAANSVQIGQGNNSTAGTVNFGGPSGMRLTNVQNGVVAAGSRDAVNGSQLNSTNIALANERDTREAGDTANAAAIAAETTRATDAEAVLDARIDANANAATAQIAASEARSITASRQSGALAMAVAGMTGAAPTGKGATAISMGVGTYGGETAVAVGVSHAVTDAVRIFGSFTKVSGGDTGAALGGSYSF